MRGGIELREFGDNIFTLLRHRAWREIVTETKFET
jgi:hypothetical protein